jgi:hypothetical protein
MDKTPYTELLTVVILSAFVPTLIAQLAFQPKAAVDLDEEETLGAEDVSLVHPHIGSAASNPAQSLDPS